MGPPSIFLCHDRRDKRFVRRLAQDLSATGAKVWIDEGELKVADSLSTRLPPDMDQMRCLGVVLSPNSANSRWVTKDLNPPQLGQLFERGTSVVNILLADCEVPKSLRDLPHADFRNAAEYENALKKLLTSIGGTKGWLARIVDPLAERLDRVRTIYARPKTWFCILCGWRCEDRNNDYLCKGCGAIRPFAGDSATLVICAKCGEGSLGIAKYCEWCGEEFASRSG